MTPNIGTVDRVLRIAVGLLLIGLALAGKIGVWGYLGLLPVTTGVLRVCPAYKLVGSPWNRGWGGPPAAATRESHHEHDHSLPDGTSCAGIAGVVPL